MGWSFRKSFGSGPIRINLSKSGIGYSMGVKGARMNFGPRGTYVNLSSHGISYRKKLTHTPSQMPPQTTYEQVNNIASAAIEQLTDTDSKDFVAELTQKAGKISYLNWFGILPLVAFLGFLLFTSFESRTIISSPATDSTFAKVTHYEGVNIRKAGNAKSRIIKSAGYGTVFQLLDSTDKKWLKVAFNDSVGYISKRFIAIEHQHYDQITTAEPFLANPYAGYQLVGGLVGFLILIPWLKKTDKRRFELALHYEMDEQFQRAYQQFSEHFATFSRSAKIWQYLNASSTNDYKRSGGASKLIKRSAIRGIAANQPPLPYFNTNVDIPCLRLSNLELYFLPERLLVKRGSTFAAVFYKNLNIDGYTTRFIEDESVPRDAQIVDQTWRYVNKSGGPDRRFSNNRQLPICAYSEYTLTSDTGIYEVITTSEQGAMDAFANFLVQIGNLQSKMAIT